MTDDIVDLNVDLEMVPKPQSSKVSKENVVTQILPTDVRKIPCINVCPPTPEPTEPDPVIISVTTASSKISLAIIDQDPLKATPNTKEWPAKYGPNSFYQYIESGKYCFNCEKRHQNVCVHEVIVDLKQGTTFTTHVSNKRCHTLVDTSSSCSCMSLAFYEQLSLPPVRKLVETTV